MAHNDLPAKADLNFQRLKVKTGHNSNAALVLTQHR